MDTMPSVIWLLFGFLVIVSFFILWGLSITKYQYFETDFGKGILLKKIRFRRIDLEWTEGKVYEFRDGYAKIMSPDLIFVRGRLRSEADYQFPSVSKSLSMGKLSKEGDFFVLEIRMPYPLLILFFAPFSMWISQFFRETEISYSIFPSFLIHGTMILLVLIFIRSRIIRESIAICGNFCFEEIGNEFDSGKRI